MRLLSTVVAFLLSLPLFAAPAVQSISPIRGLPTGGTVVTITGIDLVPANVQCNCPQPGVCAGVKVWFNDRPAAIDSATPTSIVVRTPAGTDVATIRIEVEGRQDLIVNNAFLWDPFSLPTFDDSVRYLVPITAHEVPGGFGSLWTSELTVYNPFDSPVALFGRYCPTNQIPGCDFEKNIAPLTSQRLRLYSLDEHEGALLWIPRSLSKDFGKQLRVRDLSGEADQFGSEVPVVNIETDFASIQRLLDVPTDSRYRVRLRVYGDSAQAARVTVFPASGGTMIETTILALGGNAGVNDIPLNPAWNTLDPISAVVRASGHERVRIEISSITFGDPPFPATVWGLVSLTNNETNHFTVITPQR